MELTFLFTALTFLIPQESIPPQPQGSSTEKIVGPPTGGKYHLGAPNSTQHSPGSSTEEITRPTKRGMVYLGAPNTTLQRSHGYYAEEIKRRSTVLSTTSIPRPITAPETKRRLSSYKNPLET
ncbi:hypothetical protein ElyMa_003239400 [Elysia marginata]|uniref:Zasp-like motif domain-containing protein n=1 Tax=Elysia marginata TaxID=1093978 RepID=A0AAV4J7K9_9GAST|nr:hypothetical protein ElyMa_003239400 [Elysia marginata]